MQTLLDYHGPWSEDAAKYLSEEVARCAACRTTAKPKPSREVSLSSLNRSFNHVFCFDYSFLDEMRISTQWKRPPVTERRWSAKTLRCRQQPMRSTQFCSPLFGPLVRFAVTMRSTIKILSNQARCMERRSHTFLQDVPSRTYWNPSTPSFHRSLLRYVLLTVHSAQRWRAEGKTDQQRPLWFRHSISV